MSKKIKWIIISIIIAIIAAIAVITIINEVQLNYTVENISEYNYFLLEENEKYGVIDKNGKVIIEAKYEAVQIPNQSKGVFVCVNGYDQKKKEYDTIVYNENKEQLFENYKNVQVIPIYANIDTTPYEKSVLIYKEEGKSGLINLEGKQITKPIYDEISSINYKEGTFLVKVDDKQGVINMKGKTVIKPEYNTISSDNYYNTNTKNNKNAGFIVSKKTDDGYRYGYINYRGDIVLQTNYTELERVTEIQNDKDAYFIAFKDGQAGLLKNNKTVLNHEYEDIQYNVLDDIFIIQRNGKQGVVNKEGQIILYPEYDNIFMGGIYLNAIRDGETLIFDLQGNNIETDIVSMSNTGNPNYFITIDENSIYRVVDKEGKVLLDNGYSYIEYLKDDYFIVAKNWKNGIININGKSVVEIKYDSIFHLNDTNLLQAEINDGKIIELYNMNIEKVAQMTNATVKECMTTNNSKKYIVISSKNNFEYYDADGNKLEAKDVFTKNKLVSKRINGKWGFVDINGELKVNNEYDMVTDFNEYGFAGIKKGNKWGVINQEGEIVQEPIYKIDWNLPEFIGKYYRINAWYGDVRYSSDILK